MHVSIICSMLSYGMPTVYFREDQRRRTYEHVISTEVWAASLIEAPQESAIQKYCCVHVLFFHVCLFHPASSLRGIAENFECLGVLYIR